MGKGERSHKYVDIESYTILDPFLFYMWSLIGYWYQKYFIEDWVLIDHLVHREKRTEKYCRLYRNRDFQLPVFYSVIPGLRLGGYIVLFKYCITFSEKEIILFIFHSLVQGEGQKMLGRKHWRTWVTHHARYRKENLSILYLQCLKFTGEKSAQE